MFLAPFWQVLLGAAASRTALSLPDVKESRMLFMLAPHSATVLTVLLSS